MIQKILEGFSGHEAADALFGNDVSNALFNFSPTEVGLTYPAVRVFEGFSYRVKPGAVSSPANPAADSAVWEAVGGTIDQSLNIASTNGISNKAVTQALAELNINFGGELTDLNAEPTGEGMYIPRAEGVYPNFNNLSYAAEEGFVLFVVSESGISKIQIPLNQTIESEVSVDNVVFGVNGKAVFDYAIKRISDINALRAYPGQTEGEIINLVGYYVTGDKKPLLYVWGAGPSVDDGGATIQADGGAWMAVFKDSVDIVDFGAINNLNNTTAFKNALKYCYLNSIKLTTPGHFKSIISDQLLTEFDENLGTLNLSLGVYNSITVESEGSIGPLIHISKNTFYDVEVNGRGVTLDMNNKSSGFIYTENKNPAELGGAVFIKDVTVLNTRKGADITAAAFALATLGSFKQVKYERVYVNGVSIEAGGSFGNEAKGICVTDFEGVATFDDCEVNNVTSPIDIDADGFAIFSRMQDGFTTQGVASFINCRGRDNKGRHIKSQCSNTTVVGGKFTRQYISTIQQGVDLDFQAGNGVVDGVTLEYKKNAEGASPLSTSFIPVAFQNKQQDAEKVSTVNNLTIYTEVEIPVVCYLFNGGRSTTASVQNVAVYDILSKPAGSNTLQRCAVEFEANELLGSEGLKLRVSDVSVNTSSALIGYTGLSSNEDLSQKLSVYACNNRNELNSATFRAISGSIISDMKFTFAANGGFNTFLEPGFKINFDNVAPNIDVTFDIGNTQIFNGPVSFPSSGYASVATSSQSATGWIYREVSVNGGVNIFGNLTGTWNVIK